MSCSKFLLCFCFIVLEAKRFRQAGTIAEPVVQIPALVDDFDEEDDEAAAAAIDDEMEDVKERA